MSRSGKSLVPALFIIAFGLAALLVFAAMGIGAPAGAYAQQAAVLHIGDEAATIAQTDLLDQPAAGSAVLATMPINARAKVNGGPFNDGWYWLEYNGVLGYAPGTSLVLVDANYKPVPTATATATPTATATATPISPYAGLVLGELKVRSVVRNGPAANARAIKTWWVGRRVLMYQTATDAKGTAWVRVSEPPEAPMWVVASSIRQVAPVKFEGTRFKGKWVNVNISQQIVTAYEDGYPVKVTLASTGTASHPTNLGVQRVSWRVTSREMIGGSIATGDYYDLPNVPYPQYFNSTGEALHGTYWHDNFGRPMSHGCVNLSTPMSQWLYNWGFVGMIVWVHY